MQEFTSKSSRTVYLETFDQGPGGWLGWCVNGPGLNRLPIRDSATVSCGPWWIDANHAPPGAGYLHLLYVLHTAPIHDPTGRIPVCGGRNRFIEGGYSRNLTNAEITVRVRGEVELRGAQMVLLVQAELPHTTVNQVLTGQPIQITSDWTEQTLHLTPDPEQWRCMGARHNLHNVYGCDDIDKVLKDVNLDIIFVLFPLDVVPLGPISDDPHRLLAAVDYPVDPSRLPEGCVWLDQVEIRYPD